MRRDMDLVRHILFVTEEADGDVSIDELTDQDWSRDMVGYHMVLMNEAGLIVASFASADNDPYYFASVDRLTWEGHDFLDAARSETIWNRTKDVVKKLGGSVAFDLLKKMLVSFADIAAQQLVQTSLS